MIPSLLLTFLAPTVAAPTPAPAYPPLAHAQGIESEYEKRRAEAESDVAKLWELVDWCEARALERERRSCLQAILRIDDGDRKAHELLGHVEHDGRWFTSEKKLEAYKREQAERKAKEEGLVPYGDAWVRPEDLPFLERGLVRDAEGNWVDPELLRRQEEGWVQQDLTWIPPDEIPNVEKGLWKCGEQWLPLAEADAYHAKLGQWWEIPSEHFVLSTTLPREVAMRALAEIERTFGDLVRIYGKAPLGRLPVVVLSSGEQYSKFEAGDEEARWPDTDPSGLSSIHGAFFAEALHSPKDGSWNGAGAAYWDDSSEAARRFGVCFVRHAAGQSYGEAIDPSPKAIAQAKHDPEKFWGEKRIPAWFRYGAATYVERYYVDSFVAQGGDPHWARRWSVNNLLNKGGLEPLSRVFQFNVGGDAPEASQKLLNQSGLLVAFVVDGDVADVKKAHAEVKAALKAGDAKAIQQAFAGLQKAIEAHEDELRMFAGI